MAPGRARRCPSSRRRSRRAPPRPAASSRSRSSSTSALDGIHWYDNVDVSFNFDGTGAGITNADQDALSKSNTAVTVYVRAHENDRVDGGDTKVFAPQLAQLNAVQGPLFVNGGEGQDRTGLLEREPVMLPGERNVTPSMGKVVTSTPGTLDGSIAATVTIDHSHSPLIPFIDVSTESGTTNPTAGCRDQRHERHVHADLQGARDRCARLQRAGGDGRERAAQGRPGGRGHRLGRHGRPERHRLPGHVPEHGRRDAGHPDRRRLEPRPAQPDRPRRRDDPHHRGPGEEQDADHQGRHRRRAGQLGPDPRQAVVQPVHAGRLVPDADHSRAATRSCRRTRTCSSTRRRRRTCSTCTTPTTRRRYRTARRLAQRRCPHR